MATTVHEPPVVDSGRPPGQTASGNGGRRNWVPAAGNLRGVQDSSSAASRTGIWVGLAGITMMFAAFTSALIVRQGSAMDWRHFALPPVLYLNTALLFASSVTLEIARRRVAAFARGLEDRVGASLGWLYLTLGLGLMFVGGQYEAWLQLKAQGLYLATNPSSSFFYVLTAVHVLHVLGGLGGLTLVITRLSRRIPTLRRSTLDTASCYWHFIDILWLYLLWLLWMKL
ncbi:MAG TPA: cytochrome c oxidase subunit 3 [Terriglobales bacterium]|nr:cytochrome c oxidase subunit 3 [Terriglobales bacterium]